MDARPRSKVAQAVEPFSKERRLANFNHRRTVAAGLHIVKAKCAICARAKASRAERRVCALQEAGQLSNPEIIVYAYLHILETSQELGGWHSGLRVLRLKWPLA